MWFIAVRVFLQERWFPSKLFFIIGISPKTKQKGKKQCPCSWNSIWWVFHASFTHNLTQCGPAEAQTRLYVPIKFHTEHTNTEITLSGNFKSKVYSYCLI